MAAGARRGADFTSTLGKDMLDEERTCLIRKGGKCMKALLFMELICRTARSQENRQLLVDSHGKMPTFS